MVFCHASWAAAASIIVDVSQTSAPFFNDYGDGTGQTFTPSVNGYLEGVSLYIAKAGAGADTTVTIHTLNSGASGLQDIVGSATILKADIPTSKGWVYFDFTVSVPQSAGTPLAFTVSTPASGATGYVVYWYSSFNPYSEGELFNPIFRTSPSSDFAFMTHVSPVPEPNSLWIVGLGICGVLFKRNRRAEQGVAHQRAIRSAITFQPPSQSRPWADI